MLIFQLMIKCMCDFTSFNYRKAQLSSMSGSSPRMLRSVLGDDKYGIIIIIIIVINGAGERRVIERREREEKENRERMNDARDKKMCTCRVPGLLLRGKYRTLSPPHSSHTLSEVRPDQCSTRQTQAHRRMLDRTTHSPFSNMAALHF